MDLSRWSLILALLLAPAALAAQDTTKHGSKDSSFPLPAAKPPAAKTAVICRDGTSGTDDQSCTSHGGVDAVTTNASRNGRVDPRPAETGQGDPTMSPDGGVKIKTDTTQPAGWGIPRDIKTDSGGAASDSSSS